MIFLKNKLTKKNKKCSKNTKVIGWSSTSYGKVKQFYGHEHKELYSPCITLIICHPNGNNLSLKTDTPAFFLIGWCVWSLESQLTSSPLENGSVFTLALDLDSVAQPLSPY